MHTQQPLTQLKNKQCRNKKYYTLEKMYQRYTEEHVRNYPLGMPFRLQSIKNRVNSGVAQHD